MRPGAAAAVGIGLLVLAAVIGSRATAASELTVVVAGAVAAIGVGLVTLAVLVHGWRGDEVSAQFEGESAAAPDASDVETPLTGRGAAHDRLDDAAAI